MKIVYRLLLLCLMIIPSFISAQVDTAWVRRYNGTANNADKIFDMAVDDSGNVYVTGYSAGTGATGYVTIKYHPSGDTAWIRNDFPGDALVVDGFGNAYVTGIVNGDYATVKFYPDGDTAWFRRYNGPANGYDRSRALAVDASGNVYVTGYSQGLNSGADFATIKYFPNGDVAWVSRYAGPEDGSDRAVDITVDVSGNVYVIGTSFEYDTIASFVTIKYYPNGDSAWGKKYPGPIDNYISPSNIEVDDSGGVYFTGLGTGPTGSYDYITIKYQPNGETAWIRFYNGGADMWDWPYALAVDDSHYVYVTGSTSTTAGLIEYATIKYTPDGDTCWVRKYSGSGSWENTAYDLTLDQMGNVYVTGAGCVNGNNADYLTIKYYPSGQVAWLQAYNGPALGADTARAIAVDDLGNVYVAGGSPGPGTSIDFATVKYSPTGEVDESFCCSEAFELKYDIFPNPCRRSADIRISHGAKNGALKIYDISGRLIMSHDYCYPSDAFRWNVTDRSDRPVSQGVYFVRIDGSSAVGKIIVTK